MISFEKQQQLWTEYVATMLTLNALGADKWPSCQPFKIMTFPEFVDKTDFEKYHKVPRYSFIDNEHYDFKNNELQTLNQWYSKL